MAKVSIIVPVYNVAAYLEATLDSLVNQTMRDIEILCYDDCSDDGSAEILDRYAQQDGRVKVVHYTENKTAAQGRKDGTLAAVGEYILYVDGDDLLELTACEDLVQLMDQKQIDMIHFNTNVVCDESMPEGRLNNMKMMLKPYKGKLEGNILNACFVEQKFHFQIWNKIYKAAVAKRAMTMFPDGRFSKAQDVFAFYLISYFTQSYLGMPDKAYYVYNFGRGVTGHQTISRPTIDRYADQVLVVNGIRDFLNSLNVWKVYRDSFELLEKRLMNDSLAQLVNHVAPDDIPYAFEKMCEKWGVPAVIGYLADKQVYQTARWAQQLKPSAMLQSTPRKTKRIGTFYHSLRNGGAQRVVADLATLWSKMGYEVVIFTDSEANEDDYEVPGSCKRVVLPEFAMNNPELRKQRVEVLYNSIRDMGIDLFITHAWMNPSLLWDILCVKMADALFYIHTHSIFSMPLLSNTITNYFFTMPGIYALADGVMVLSRTDALYWKHYNDRVFTVVNPLTFDLHAVPMNPLEGKNIVWVGRIANEKYPIQAIEIMGRVLARHSDAKLIVVGSGSEQLENRMRRRAEELNIQDHVEFCGFQKDVEPYYLQGDIFLCTSQFEGFSLTIQEAQSHGMPCVVYEMPYLTLLETNKGSYQVPMQDKDAAAERICELLDNRELLKRMGAEARENVLELCDIDFEEQWQKILDSTQFPRREPAISQTEQSMLHTLSEHTQYQIKTLSSQLQKAKGGKAKPAIITNIAELRFAPMPKHGPFKVIRRKIHTALRIWVLEGWSSLKDVIREKR